MKALVLEKVQELRLWEISLPAEPGSDDVIAAQIVFE
jgi:hypothetical protein